MPLACTISGSQLDVISDCTNRNGSVANILCQILFWHHITKQRTISEATRCPETRMAVLASTHHRPPVPPKLRWSLLLYIQVLVLCLNLIFCSSNPLVTCLCLMIDSRLPKLCLLFQKHADGLSVCGKAKAGTVVKAYFKARKATFCSCTQKNRIPCPLFRHSCKGLSISSYYKIHN